MTDGTKKGIVLAALAAALWWFSGKGSANVSFSAAGQLLGWEGFLTDNELDYLITAGILTLDQAQAISNNRHGQPADPVQLQLAVEAIDANFSDAGQLAIAAGDQ